jgi:hypothetical protein
MKDERKDRENSRVLLPLITVLVIVSTTRSEKRKKIVHPKTHIFDLVTTQSSPSKLAFLLLKLENATALNIFISSK